MVDEDRVRQRAHEIWEREGRPEGRHEEHWRQAMAQVAAEDGGGTAGMEAPGPDAGLRTPPSVVEQGLHEAADALRGTAAEEVDRQDGQDPGPRPTMAGIAAP